MHWAWAVAQKPFDAAARQSFTREVAASHLVSPSRLQVARQSYILEVSHIHLCDWRRSLQDSKVHISKNTDNCPKQLLTTQLTTIPAFTQPVALKRTGTIR